MAFDPSDGRIYGAPSGEVTEGHYANIASQVDAAYVEAQVDPVELHRRAYGRAAMELNMLPQSERTPALRAKVEALGREAAEAAFDANVGLLTEGGA
jgi:hypothetical protein